MLFRASEFGAYYVDKNMILVAKKIGADFFLPKESQRGIGSFYLFHLLIKFFIIIIKNF